MSEHLHIAEQDQFVAAAWDSDDDTPTPVAAATAARAAGRADRRIRDAEAPSRRPRAAVAEAVQAVRRVRSRAR